MGTLLISGKEWIIFLGVVVTEKATLSQSQIIVPDIYKNHLWTLTKKIALIILYFST